MPLIVLGVMAAVGTGIQVYGQVKSGQAAKAAGVAQQDSSNSQADLSDYNAKVADLQAADAIARGAQQEAVYRQGVKGMIGGQRAGEAAGNVDVGFGSPVDVASDTAFRGELDALTIRTNAARQAWGFQVNAQDLRTEATIQRKTGVNQAIAGQVAQTADNFGAVGTLIGGATSIYKTQYGLTH